MENSPSIDVYGADWCGDCIRAKAALNKFNAAFTWHNIESEEGAEQKAIDISGQKHIPVVTFSDGSFMVEPTATQIKEKLEELGQINL
ncbi:mycoredoxin [Gardnerella vaginalis]|uniref:Glutaredoxin n=1 Tax=Gardnerella vaginalis (strain ATCC 14019 / 317) TaxID=525284 RepID=E3D7F1_GARV3|nr:mycoredoxin [Gardnerella vaginalis]ADP38182.1 glutaredoxin [Gardnerella vaginalis ATCC 14019]KOS09307.1 glutaredoxin [Gardnerella vaginalis]RFT23898.1 NrdH-redoxin [Gardnerella vaginalis]TCH80774.1 mycoredoxin [Gardnerella vaginalis]TCH82778.1 mycoredoxin [Gardnerella vaginalis ATCC 14018 = JCM 11026]